MLLDPCCAIFQVYEVTIIPMVFKSVLRNYKKEKKRKRKKEKEKDETDEEYFFM